VPVPLPSNPFGSSVSLIAPSIFPSTSNVNDHVIAGPAPFANQLNQFIIDGTFSITLTAFSITQSAWPMPILKSDDYPVSTRNNVISQEHLSTNRTNNALEGHHRTSDTNKKK
jgi:hypothetical protein